MKNSFLLIFILICATPVFAKELKPFADFGIHTIVTNGPKRFEGKKMRAIVKYGELGFPFIYIESFEVIKGYPTQSKIFWRESIDFTGGVNIDCEDSESWRCSISNLHWEGSALHYDLVSPSETYKCVVKISGKNKIQGSCMKP